MLFRRRVARIGFAAAGYEHLMTDDLSRDELDAAEGNLLPEREALSILPIDGDYAGLAGLGGSTPDASGAGDTGDPATSAADVASTDAAASGSGEESVTDEPRSDQISRTDTAVSET